jgi:polynucleotide kinase-phosphatase
MKRLDFPELSLILLLGPSGAGKSTFALRHFRESEVLSSDYCRALVSNDENNQEATGDAFDILRYITAKRLGRGLLTVIDATNLRPEDRKPWIQLAREYHFLPTVLVFDVPDKVCLERNRVREDRSLSRHFIRSQCANLKRSLRSLKREGFRKIHILRGEEETKDVEIVRVPMWNDRKDLSGPFDIIGDIHGCLDELQDLLTKLGWKIAVTELESGRAWRAEGPEGRQLLFLGDLADRGPQSVEVLRLVMDLVEQGVALCVPGNHEAKLHRHLIGKKVQLRHGLAETVAALDEESSEFRERVCDFIKSLVSHLVFDEGQLIITHAGLKESMHGRGSAAIRAFCLYGDTTGETDEFGLPVRYPWAEEYRGKAMVVYGHNAVPEAEWLNRTICIDTGCVFGGKLTALRYPERVLVSVPARKVYYEPIKPLVPDAGAGFTAQQGADRMLDLTDVLGKRRVHTRHGRDLTIREENAAAALEVMSRFAADPRWLIYLPPTMAPSTTSNREGYLEHPEQALEDYRGMKIDCVVAEEKHMGSRAVIVLCRDEETALERFGIANDGIGSIYTRTGRPFFKDRNLQDQMLQRLHRALTAAGTWEKLDSNWVCLDVEILPWSAKARELLTNQYGAVGAAANAGLARSIHALEMASARNSNSSNDADLTSILAPLLDRYRIRQEQARLFRKAYRPYCWPVDGLQGYKVAPFHLLASESAVHDDRDHLWHMTQLAEIAALDPDFLIATPHREVHLDSPAECQDLIDWWLSLTSSGGEGLVIKPLAFAPTGARGLRQPALKCRGPEYLRIIYGAEYRQESHLQKLRKRGLSRKRSLALREFSLGLEGLHRFVENQPLRHIHECVFAVLALESEPVDPRL